MYSNFSIIELRSHLFQDNLVWRAGLRRAQLIFVLFKLTFRFHSFEADESELKKLKTSAKNFIGIGVRHRP